MERCFVTNRTLEGDKLDQAMGCLTGSAVTWLRYVKDRDAVKDWMDFKDKFRQRFGPSIGGSVVDQLMNIVQRGSVDEYHERFEELVVEAPHIPDDVVESMFVKGLEKGLSDQVLRCAPSGLYDIVAKARLIEMQETEATSYQYRVASKNQFSSQPTHLNKGVTPGSTRGREVTTGKTSCRRW